MDKELFKQSVREAKKIRLNSEEKSDIRQSVLNFIDHNPVRYAMEPRLGLWSTVFHYKLNFISTMSILLVVALLVGGGAGFAAEKALPGDALYPVKVGINEEVRGWLIVSEESKADWEVRRVERRLKEAEALASGGELNVETREKIEANFDAHAEKVKDRIEKFENKQNFLAAADVSAKFEASLDAHQKILDRLTNEAGDELKKEVKPIQVRIKSETDNLIKVRQRLDLRVQGEVEAEAEIKRNSSADSNENQSEGGAEAEVETNSEIKNGDVRSNGNLEVNVGL